MSEILSAPTKQMRNETHNQFNTEIKEVVVEQDTAVIDCANQFDAYIAALQDEAIALEPVAGSATTDEIVAADIAQSKRDTEQVNYFTRHDEWNQCPQI